MQENYLDVMDINYYMPTEVESDISIPTLSNGDKDLVKALYSDEALIDYGGNKDTYNVISNLGTYTN